MEGGDRQEPQRWCAFICSLKRQNRGCASLLNGIDRLHPRAQSGMPHATLGQGGDKRGVGLPVDTSCSKVPLLAFREGLGARGDRATKQLSECGVALSGHKQQKFA